jgi:enoyl-CoA hydratase
LEDLKTEAIADMVAGKDEHLVVVTRGATRILIFNRPAQRNAMTGDMRREYARQLRLADEDEAIACVIITGAHGYFSGGVDIKDRPLNAPAPMVRPHPVEAGRSMSNKPVIAMVDGPCITGALELALACTFIIASDRSTFAETHMRLGIFPGWGGCALLVSAIGARRAAQLQMTGEHIDAQRAYEWGIVNEIMPAERLFDRCMELADSMAKRVPEGRRRYVLLNRQLEGMQAGEALATELMTVDRARTGLPQ